MTRVPFGNCFQTPLIWTFSICGGAAVSVLILLCAPRRQRSGSRLGLRKCDPYQITPADAAFSQPGSWARVVVVMVSFAINSPGVYSGGIAGGNGFSERAA